METYDEFIKNILETRGRFGCGDEYHERHHIVPKCLGGTNDKDNLIDLFAKEHFIAHKLLARENPDNDSLIYAWNCMAFPKNNYEQRYELTPEEYEEVRQALSETLKGKMAGENNPHYGKRHSEETKRIISEKIKEIMKTPENNPWYGKHPTEEMLQKMRKSQRKRFSNPEEREKISRALKGKYCGENHPWFGKHHTEETKQIISEKMIERFSNPENHPMFGKKLSDETKEKISKNHADVSGAKNPAAKPVVCIDTKIVYGTTTIASEETNTNAMGICNCCYERSASSGGYRWRLLYDTTRKDGTIIPGAITLGLITEEEALAQLNSSDFLQKPS